MNGRVSFPCLFFAVLFFGFVSALRAGEAIVLENSLLRLTFDSDTGALTSMKNNKTGSEYIRTPSRKPPFTLDVYSANQSYYVNDYSLKERLGHVLAQPDSIQKNPGDLAFLRGKGVKPTMELLPTKGGGKTLLCTYPIAPAFTVKTSVTVEQDRIVGRESYQANGRSGRKKAASSSRPTPFL